MDPFKTNQEKTLESIAKLQVSVSNIITHLNDIKDELINMNDVCPVTTLPLLFVSKGIVLSILYSLQLLKSAVDTDMPNSLNALLPKTPGSDSDPNKWN